MNLSLFEHQEKFVLDFSKRFIGFAGGYGCGKTEALTAKALLCAKRNPGRLGLLLSPINAMVETDLAPAFEAAMEKAGVKWQYESKGYHIYRLFFPYQAPSRVQLLGAENHNRLRGKNAAWWGVDEFDTIQPESLQTLVLEQLMARLRAGYTEASECGFFVSTPEGFRGMHKFFVEDVERMEKEGVEVDRVLHRARTYDNYLLKPSYVESLRKQYPPALLEAYLEGNFVNLASGTVYDNYDEVLNNTTLTVDSPEFANLSAHVSADFNNGTTSGGSGLISFIFNDCMYVVDEVMHTRKTYDTAYELRQKLGSRHAYAHPDKSGGAETANSDKTNFNYLEDFGFEVVDTDAFGSRMNPDIVDRVNSVQALFLNGDKKRRLFINKEKCPNLVQALKRQTYDKNGVPTKGKVDGPLDALGYPVWNIFPASRKRGYSTGQVQG